MAEVNLRKFGPVILLDHDEVCFLLADGYNNFAHLLGLGYCAMRMHWCSAICVAVLAYNMQIEAENDVSGGKGVRIKTSWTGQIYEVVARGSGPSECVSVNGEFNVSSSGLALSNRRYSENMDGERYVANTNTMEVHDLDNEDSTANGCQIDEIIFAGHDTPFDLITEAWAKKYDNCAKCLSGSNR